MNFSIVLKVLQPCTLLPAHLPSYLLVDCVRYFPANTAWKVKGRKVKGRSSVNLMWDITHDNRPPIMHCFAVRVAKD